MASNQITFLIRVRPQPFIWFLRLFGPIAPLFGERRALDIALRASHWLIWYRVGNERWRRLRT